MTDTAIQAKNLTRRFGDFTAVDHIDIALPKGRISGFLGPNGSGKSTTIRMLCGLLTPSDGSVEILGYQIPRDAEKLRWKVGYMTQKFSLYEDLSCHENLNFMASVYGLHGKTRSQRIAAAVEEYSLGELLKQRAGTMSGGQKQRLALAATTIHKPEILLLDEPTSAVDPQSRRDFWDQLFALAENGTTILVSTHYMDEAERCHKLIFLDRGKIVADGSPKELVRHIPARVLEIESDNMSEVRQATEKLDGLVSVTQLGGRLRVMIEKDSDQSRETIARKLSNLADNIEINDVDASLEDVFVSSTLLRDRQNAG